MKKELEAAEKRMFNAIKNFDQNFWRTGIADDYITINADGVSQTKAEAFADSAHRKMFSVLKQNCLIKP